MKLAKQETVNYLEAVKQDGSAMERVPNAVKTPEFCLAAVKDNSLVLKFMPDELKTPEICLAAVQEDGKALEFVPEALKTPELCLDAVKRHGPALEWVPFELRTQKLCWKAVRAPFAGSSFAALKFVPQVHKMPVLCLYAVMNDNRASRYVPKHLRPGVAAWIKTGQGRPPFLLPKGAAKKMDVANAVFAQCLEGLELPAGCRLRLAAKPLFNGFAAAYVKASDENDLVWPKEEKKLAFCIARADHSLPEMLMRLASTLKDGHDGRHAEKMPGKLRQGCVFAIECAAEAVAGVCAKQAGDEGPRPC